jgi:hypothetical protein
LIVTLVEGILLLGDLPKGVALTWMKGTVALLLDIVSEYARALLYRN